jgi:translation initiation factor IF-2
MAESSSNRHGKFCAAAVLGLSGLIIGACSPAPGGPAPVYMMGMAGTAIPDPAAAAPTEPSMAPVALASWTEPSGSVGHTASDVIPLDDPPPQPAPAPARQVSGPAATAAMPPAAPAAPSAPVASAAPAAPAPAVSPPAAPMVTASSAPEPSAAEEARAEAAPPPVRERTASAPARADLVAAGAGMPRPAPYSRPSYYWP